MLFKTGANLNGIHNFDTLQKIITISFLGIYLLANTQLAELFRVNLLVQHYIQHKTEDPSITILAFLDMHYMHGNPMDSDYKQDMELPFKTNHLPVKVSVNNFALATVTDVVPALHFNAQSRTQPLLRKTLFPLSSFYEVIWQPPRLS